VPSRKDHADRARLVRNVLDAFPSDDDSSPSDKVVRRRVEGAIIAEELAAGTPGPISAKSDGPDDPPTEFSPGAEGEIGDR
jgi:hypothetical protein